MLRVIDVEADAHEQALVLVDQDGLRTGQLLQEGLLGQEATEPLIAHRAYMVGGDHQRVGRAVRPPDVCRRRCQERVEAIVLGGVCAGGGGAAEFR